MNDLEILEIQSQIGLSDELTDKFLVKLKSLMPCSTHLPLYELFLLERYDETLPMITYLMSYHFNYEYLINLQNSDFYLHRKAAASIAKTINFNNKKDFLMKFLSDGICDVVKEATTSIRESKLFNQEDLLNILMLLYNNKYTAVKILSIDILSMLTDTSVLNEILISNNYRIRLKLAMNFDLFRSEDQIKILNELKTDIVEEIRIEISKKLKSLDHLDLLKDPSEMVRSNYLSNVIDQIKDEEILKELVQDESWEVKKILLNLTGELFKNITIPLIKNFSNDVSWRIKYNILELIEKRLDNEFVCKMMSSYLFGCLKDKVSEIRNKCSNILIMYVERFSWMEEVYYELYNIVNSSNYLFRISVIPLAVHFDRRFKTALCSRFETDTVVNVRDYFNDWISK